MAGDKEYASPEHIGLDSKPKDIQDKVDYATEIMGETAGRIARFLPDSAVDFYGDDKKKKEERRHLSMLEQLMLDAAYKAAYDTAIRTLYETQNAVYEALKESGEALQLAEAKHNDILERASTMSDGTRVFLDDDGNAYTEDGRKLTEDEYVQVEWKDNSPSWSEFKDSTETVEKEHERNTQIQRHSDRLDQIEREIRDAENPPSKEKLEELTKEMEEIQRTVDMSGQDANLQLSDSTPVVVPELKF